MKRKSSTRKKRKGLSDKDLIKLIKKLKPQTQQIVRVNIGDKEKDRKKKPGEVQSSYNPPFVFPGYPAITQVIKPDKPQLPAPLAPVPLSAAQEKELMKSSQKEVEKFVKSTRAASRRKKVDVVEEPQTSEFESPVRFSRPRQPRESSLGADSAMTSRFYEAPSNNDRYLPIVFDLTAMEGDESGTAPNALPSDEWKLSPDGDQPSIKEEAPPEEAPPEEAPPETPIKEEAPLVELTPEVKLTPQEEALLRFESGIEPKKTLPPIPQIKEEKLSAPSVLPPIKGKVPPLVTQPMIRDAPTLSASLMKLELEDAMKNQGYTGVPKQFLSTRKPNTLRSGLSKADVQTLYESLIYE